MSKKIDLINELIRKTGKDGKDLTVDRLMRLSVKQLVVLNIAFKEKGESDDIWWGGNTITVEEFMAMTDKERWANMPADHPQAKYKYLHE